MKVVIRADAGMARGTGHVYRCATLAEGIRSRGGEVVFICRGAPGEWIRALEARDFRVHRFDGPEGEEDARGGRAREERQRGHSYDWERDREQTAEAITREGGFADWLVVDHYALDARWETSMRTRAGKILVLDDLADRPHDCDILLDATPRPGNTTIYRDLVPKGARVLLGPRYALLRREFYEARSSIRRRAGDISRILVFFGGSDLPRDTEKTLEALERLDWSGVVADVVLGSANPRGRRIMDLCTRKRNIVCHHATGDMAALMAAADIALGAGGTTSWERCYLGLPSILLIQADNQAEVVANLEALGAAWSLGRSGMVDAGKIARALERARGNPSDLVRMGTAAVELMGGDAHDRGETLLRLMTGEAGA